MKKRGMQNGRLRNKKRPRPKKNSRPGRTKRKKLLVCSQKIKVQKKTLGYLPLLPKPKKI